MKYRTISPDELKAILGDHRLWLEDHSKGARANLSSADLSSADLSSADLRSANLRSANLSSANLLIFQFQRHIACFTLDGTLRMGCHALPISEWVLGYKEIGESNGYTEEQIEVYGDFIKLCAKQFERAAQVEGE